MKILFSADMHIKIGQKNVPVFWARERYRALFLELRKLQEECDLFIFGGDIFDRMPSIEELELFFMFINSCTIKTFIYSGNHEALKKNTTFLSNLKSIVHDVNDKVTILDDFATVDGIDFIPYNKLKEFEKDPVLFYGDILCTHVRGDIPPHVKAEIDLSLFDRWKVVLAGDLHSYDNCQRNILYPGSPLTTTFHRNAVDTGIIIFDTAKMDHKWIKLQLPQLIRKSIKAGEAMPKTEYDHTIYEVEGDMSELLGLQDNDLIDKKIIKRDIDTALILNPEMSLEEEVSEYLKYILQVDDTTVNNAIMELNNHADKFI